MTQAVQARNLDVAPAPHAIGSAEPSTRESSAWLHTLPVEKRAALHAMHKLSPAWNLVALGYLAVWVTSGMLMLAFPHWAVWVPGYALIGISIHAMAILMHEGIHGALFRSRGLDRWSGFLLGSPALFSFTAYRVAHLAHHRYNRTEKDPDEYWNFTNNRLAQSILFYAWIIFGMFIYIFHIPVTALKLGTKSERVDVVVEYILLAAIYATVIVLASRTDHLVDLIHLWVIPMGLAMVFGNVRGWAEHAMTVPGHPMTCTRTVTSNTLVSFLMCNLNYHLEHHLCPAMPWYNLRKMHVLMQPEYRRAGSYVQKSYLVFLFSALRLGVHRIAPQPAYPTSQ